MRWIVPGLVGEGLSLLVGRQKLGKSWLALDLAAAVASGGKALGCIPCTEGDVLYVDLQNGTRRVRRRLDMLFPDAAERSRLSRLEWAHDGPSLHDGFIEALDDWRCSVALPALVVLDVPQHPGEEIHELDCIAFTDIQFWAAGNGVAVLIVIRSRKAGGSDPLEMRGEVGRIATFADTTLLLDRDNSGFTLSVRGRDLADRRLALGFAAGRWLLLGDVDDARFSETRQQILEMAMSTSDRLSAGDFAGELGLPVDNVRRTLSRLAKSGELKRCGYGIYCFPHRDDESGDAVTASANPVVSDSDEVSGFPKNRGKTKK
jgi:hypothetical protein